MGWLDDISAPLISGKGNFFSNLADSAVTLAMPMGGYKQVNDSLGLTAQSGLSQQPAQISYDSNGKPQQPAYVSPSSYGPNPLLASIGKQQSAWQGDGARAVNAQNGGNLFAMQSGMNNYAQQSGAGYPAMPNQYGLGSQSQPQPQAQPFNQPPGMSGGSFNPWSMMGEANSR